MKMAYELSDSITINASPAAVFTLLSDITRTGEWSAQCYRAHWNDADDTHATDHTAAPSHGIGSTFTGYNRTPEREWSTTSEVITYKPNTEFSWQVLSSGTIWGYRMEPAPNTNDATLLTEYTAFTPAGEAYFHSKFGPDASAQETQRQHAATAGIIQTLTRIKEILEG